VSWSRGLLTQMSAHSNKPSTARGDLTPCGRVARDSFTPPLPLGLRCCSRKLGIPKEGAFDDHTYAPVQA